MSSLFRAYLTELSQYTHLQNLLHNSIEELVDLIPLKEHGFDFSPAQSSILEQIKFWPEGVFNLPPAAWVQPREGSIKYQSVIWEFLFHGSGLSFTNIKTRQEISIEYTQAGTLGITRWTIQLYLKTLPGETLNANRLLAEHVSLFDEAERSKYLIKVPPLFGDGNADQTYTFLAK